MIRTPGSHTLVGLIPDARLHVFPDAAHASIFQYPDEAAAVVEEFLSAATAA
jgi:pimeloyl-ACP methyl ester carboxylesterase